MSATPTLPSGLREAVEDFLVEIGYLRKGLATAINTELILIRLAPFFPAQPSVEQGDTAEGVTQRTDSVFDHFPITGPNVAARIQKARDYCLTLERDLAAVTWDRDLWKTRAVENENEAASLEGRIAVLQAENEKLRGELDQVLTGNEPGNVPWVNARRDEVMLENLKLLQQLTALQAWEKQAREVCNSLAQYLRPGPIPTSEPTERDYLLADLNALLSTPPASG